MQPLQSLLLHIRNSKATNLDAWRGEFIVWMAAATAGLVIVSFAWLTEYAGNLFFLIQKLYWWLPLILTPIGGVLIVWITIRWFEGAKGSGIPQTIAALQETEDSAKLSSLISIKLAIGKILLGVSAIAVGFSSGREGPSVQVGASVMHAFRRFLPSAYAVHPKHLILAGGAAGIAAAFNTPLAGVIFAIEELGRKFEQKTSGILITAIILSGLVSISLQGNYTYFGNIAVGTIDETIILPLLICALACGIFGGIFSRTLIESSSLLEGGIGEFKKHHPLWWAGFCGLIVALLGVMSDGAAHGSGYRFAHGMIDGTLTESWQYAPIKYFATVFTFHSGVPGGIFAPALSIGAGIGNDLLPFFAHQQSSTAICVLCMAGFLAAVTQAPITSFIIVMEMIDGHEMVISLMMVALVSAIISRIFSPPLYSTLANVQLMRHSES